MTIIHPNAFHAAPSAGFDGVFDWDFFLRVLPRGIMPTDFDAVIEINHRYLIFETKDEGCEPSNGQRNALLRLLPLGNFTIVWQWGKLAPTSWRWDRKHICSGPPRACDAATILAFVETWARLSDQDCGGRTLDDVLRDFAWD